MQPKSEAMVTLGKFNGVFGVQGWVKVYSYTSKQDDILRYKPWYIYKNDAWHEIKMLSGKRQGKGLIANIEGIDDRDAAFNLNGMQIGVPRECLPNLPEDQYYWSDLTGLEVFTVSGQNLGTVSHLFETGANDVMVVKGDRERWLPWLITDVVKSVDLVDKTIIVDWDPDF